MFREFAAGMPCPPAMGALLRIARREAVFIGDDHAWCCHFFGVARQQDNPVAPFACLGDGLNPGTDYWLCANPVTLHLQRDSFVLADGFARGLRLDQARRLTETLNAHFATDGMRFFAPHANRWYLHLSHPPMLETHPLSEVVGQRIQRLLPQGEDALKWHKRLNEIQMLLHEHPVNTELEQHGEAPVNSVWVWGGGKLVQGAERAGLTVWARDALTRGLAQAHGCQLQQLPSSAMDFQEGGMKPGQHLAVLDQLTQADLHHDSRDWHETLERMERHWFAPLLEALRDGTISHLVLHVASTNRVFSYTLKQSDLFKFWRRAQPLGAYLA